MSLSINSAITSVNPFGIAIEILIGSDEGTQRVWVRSNAASACLWAYSYENEKGEQWRCSSDEFFGAMNFNPEHIFDVSVMIGKIIDNGKWMGAAA